MPFHHILKVKTTTKTATTLPSDIKEYLWLLAQGLAVWVLNNCAGEAESMDKNAEVLDESITH